MVPSEAALGLGRLEEVEHLVIDDLSRRAEAIERTPFKSYGD